MHTEASWNTLYRFALSLAKSEAEAEDLVQQTLVKALTHFPSFFETNYQLSSPESIVEFSKNTDGEALAKHLLNWMIKIAKNTFLDELNRSSRKIRHISLDDWDDASPLELRSDDSLPHSTAHPQKSLSEMEREFFEKALDDDWSEKLSSLSPKQKSVLFLIAEDYSYKEIAELLDIPIGTVMSTLSRTVAKLRKTAKS